MAELLTIAKAIVHGMNAMLGNDFTPANSFVDDSVRTRWGRLKLKLIRSRTEVTALDQVQMLAQVSAVCVHVKQFKQGACAELAMYAYNRARQIDNTYPQIIVLASDQDHGHGDDHAFVLLGVQQKFPEPVPISQIAADHPDAVAIDYWASRNIYSDYQGAFPIGVYEEEASGALGAYDMEKATTWSLT